MSEWLVPLSDIRLSDADLAAVLDVYRGGWLSQGPRVMEFEQAFARYLHAREAIALSSGTAALQLACASLDLAPGDEVILPSLTFAATAAAVVHAGGTPIWADIRGLHQPWLSADDAAARVTRRTRAIVNVSYGGEPGEGRALRALADACGIVLIEDAAHGLGARAADLLVGTIGHFGAFSFFANKNLPLGEGGMLVAEDLEITRRLRRLRSHGMTSSTWERHGGTGPLEYDVLEPGFNLRLDEPRAALGTRLLERLEAENSRRRELITRYDGAFATAAMIEPGIRRMPATTSAAHIYTVLLDERVDRARVRTRLRDRRIQTSVHYPPLHLTTAYKAFSVSLPVTEDHARRTMTLPLFPHMTRAQQDLATDATKQAVESCSIE